MMPRRFFLQRMCTLSAGTALSPLLAHGAAEHVADALFQLNRLTPALAAHDDELWRRIAQAFTVSATLLNLNNGGVSPQPKVVQDAVDRYYHLCNETPTYYMWKVLDKGREPLREKLAALAGASAEEVAINRNTTEALGTVTWGLDLQAGDEVVMSRQDYPNMIHAWKQRELRHGIKIQWLNFTLPIEDEDSVVKAFVDASHARTRVWHITHIINWTGQVMPVTKLCAEARKRGIATVVDGAHSFAHLSFSLTHMAPDYYGTSLHKWLCAPFGTGLLYVRREHIETLWPLFPNDTPRAADIRKFEHLGVRAIASEQATAQAIEFHHAIGSERKEARLRYLKDYWCDRIKDHPRIRLTISRNPAFSCGLGSFMIDGMDPNVLASRLFHEYQIHTSPVIWENIRCVRITPHVYTSTRDLDRFVDVVLKIANG